MLFVSYGVREREKGEVVQHLKNMKQLGSTIETSSGTAPAGMVDVEVSMQDMVSKSI